jgi:translocation and assembly module TamB
MGVTAAGLRTDEGRKTVARAALEAANEALNGSITVSEVRGSFFTGLIADGVVIRETDGTLLVEIPSLQIGYGLRDILGGRVVLGRLELSSPYVHLIRRPGRPLNLEEVLGLGGEGDGGRSPLIAFRDVQITDGTLVLHTPADPRDSLRVDVEETADGYMRVRSFTDLNAILPYARITSPLPTEDGIRLDVATLGGIVSDPAMQVENLNGRIEARGDSVLLDLGQVRLPSSQAEVRGALAFGTGELLLDLMIEAEEVSTDDVRGLISDIPSGLVGTGMVEVRSDESGVLTFRLEGFSAEGVGGGGRVTGRLAMEFGPGDHWGFNDTGLDLDDFDLEYIRPYFDTLPLVGRATGRFESDGPGDAMDMVFDVTFRDSLVEGWPVTTLDARGEVATGVPGDIVFRDFAVHHAELDLGTVRRILPAVDLRGRLTGSGVLNGPWLEVEFEGDLSHEDAPLPRTNASGLVRVDARGDTLGVWSELLFDSLSIEGLHSSYPQLAAVRGMIAGRVVIGGYVDAALLEASLEGPAGALFADGTVVLLPYTKGWSDLDLRVARLDLGYFNPQLPRTHLFGRLRGAGVLDSLSGSWAQVNAAIRASSLAGVRTDSVSVSMVVTDNVIRLDTLDVWGTRLRLSGTGQIGISEGLPGTISLTAANDSMAAIEPLLESLFGALDVEFQEVGQPWGSIALEVTIDGTLGNHVVSGEVDVRDMQRGGLYASRLELGGTWTSDSGTFELEGSVDSLEMGRWEFADIAIAADGRVDSINWYGRSRFGPDGLGAWIAGGRMISDGEVRSIPVDSMGFLLASGAWFVDGPAMVQVGDSGIDFEEVTASSDFGAGRVVLDGRIPSEGSGHLNTSVEALPLEDLWILLQRNYRNVGGDLGGTFTLTGPRDEPRMDLSVGMVNGRFGRFQAPQMLGHLEYASRRVVGDLRLLRTGEEILNVAVALPLDLSLTAVERRTLPEQISIQAVADGVDMSFLDAATPLVRDAGGTLDADFGLTGTWENPELTGRIEIADGTGTYPGLGVRHEELNGEFHLSGDTIAIDRLSLSSGRGNAQLSGYVRLEELTRPILDLRVEASEFRGVDLRDFLTLTASGLLELRGPVFDATATGDGTVTSGVLYYADLITKDIINIEDTLYTEFVDPLLIRREGLGVAFHNRFLDSLRVDSLRLRMGSDVWMRSSEANIQLLGDVTVSKAGRQYRLNGDLQTPRGVYRVTPGPSLVQLVATRDFTVTRGEVQYLGTPDLNAAVDIEARHRLRSVRGEDVTVFVHIGGTVYEPRLTFTSDIHPPISETEVLSYLFFGAPSVEAFAGTGNFADQRLVEQGLNQFLGAVSGQLEYSLISDLNVPLDYVQIRPTGVGTEMYGVDVAVGKRLGEKWFVTVNPRLCSRDDLFTIETLRSVGASLEYRLSREWMLLLSGDPVQSCSAFSTQRFAEKYQLGLDLFWEKRY